MKKYYTTSKSGEWVYVDQALAKQLVSSGKKKPGDFQIVEEPDQVPSSSSSAEMPSASSVRQEAPSVSEGLGELRKPLALGAAGYESVPSFAGAIDLKREFPYVGIKPEEAGNLQNVVDEKYRQILDNPNFPEKIVTDPVMFIPGVGEYAAAPKILGKAGEFLARYATDPVIQATAEYARDPEISASEAGIMAGVGTGVAPTLAKAGKVIGAKALEKFTDRYGVDPRGAEFLQEAVPNIGSTRKAVEASPSQEILEESVNEMYNSNPGELVDIFGNMANNAKGAIEEFRRGTNWSKQYNATGKIPSLAEAKKWESRINEFEDDITDILKSNSGRGPSREQMQMLLDTYKDVPPLANELRTAFSANPWLAPTYEKYLAKAPSKMDMSIPGIISGTVGKVTDPENLTRASRTADYLSGKSNFPIVGLAASMD